jgi:hypothetical protein
LYRNPVLSRNPSGVGVGKASAIRASSGDARPFPVTSPPVRYKVPSRLSASDLNEEGVETCCGPGEFSVDGQCCSIPDTVRQPDGSFSCCFSGIVDVNGNCCLGELTNPNAGLCNGLCCDGVCTVEQTPECLPSCPAEQICGSECCGTFTQCVPGSAGEPVCMIINN